MSPKLFIQNSNLQINLPSASAMSTVVAWLAPPKK